MRLSEQRRLELYEAISEEIMRLRIRYNRGEVLDVDHELFKLEQRIWGNVHKALSLDGPA